MITISEKAYDEFIKSVTGKSPNNIRIYLAGSG